MNKLLKISIVLFCFVFTNLNANTDVTLQLAWKNQFQFAGYYIAKEKGFYSDVGLNVKINEFDNGIDVTNDVAAGKVDFGVGRSSLISDKYSGKPVVMLAAIFQHSPVMLLTKKRDDIVKIEDLKNKKIMLTSDQVAMASINAMLQTYNITPQMYTTQQHSFNVQDLIDGKTDVMLSYISNEPYTMEQQNVPYTVFAPKDYNFDFYSDILFTSENFLSKNPKIVKDFREASLKGWRYALEHKQEAVDLILKKYNTQNKTKGSLLYEANAIEKLINKDKVELGDIDTKRIEYITQIYSLMGFIKNKKPIKKLVYKVEKKLDKNGIQLTNEEKSWLKQHPNIVIGADQNWQPFDFKNRLGKHDGFNAGFIDLLRKKLNIDIKVEMGAWDDLQQKVKDKKLSGLIGVYKTEQRDTYMEFTKPYFVLAQVVLVQKDTPAIDSLNELDGKTLGLKSGGSDIEYFKKNYPKIKQKIYNSNAEVIRAVSAGEVDAGASNIGAASYEMQRNFISNIKVGYEVTNLSGDMRIGIRKDWSMLASILQKAMDAITKDEINLILDKWLKLAVTNDNLSKLNLTKEEKDWLRKKIPIKYVYDPDWAPFEWKNELGHHTGIVADIINIIAQETGITFTALDTDSWAAAKEKVKNREADMYSAINESEEVLKYMDFTNKNLFDVPFAFVTRTDDKSDYFNLFDALVGKKIAVVEGYPIEDMIRNDRPDIELITVKNMTEGFQKLRNGDIDVFCEDIVTAKRFINLEGYDDLRIAVKTGYTFDLKIALRDDWSKEAISIINKALNNITKKEMDDIYNQWTNVTYKETVDYSLIWKILAGVLVVILLFIYSNRKLKMIVQEKTNELQEVLKSLEVKVQMRTKDLEEQQQQFSAMVANVPGAIYRAKNDSAWPIYYFSDEIENMTGYSSKDFTESRIETFSTIMYPDDVAPIGKEIQEQFLQGKKFQVDYRIITKSGDIRWVRSQGQSIQTEDGESWIDGVLIDITEQKELEEQIEKNRIFLNTLLDSQEQLIITTNGKVMVSANKAFLDFYSVSSIDEFKEKYGTDCICETFNKNASDGYLQTQMGDEKWIDYIINRSDLDNTYKAMITENGIDYVFSVTAAILPGDNGLKSAVFTNITEIERAKQEVESIHKHTRESIEYASLIQGALIPDNQIFQNFFQDHFAIWDPKDIVGGDIYLMNKINDDELILMVIDCTGHGVPGAFVTMLVKAIERQLMANIHKDKTISPAKILGIFNRSIKNLLKQESIDSVSNAGFDGGIIYYNKKEKIVKFSGAETYLFYIDEKREFQTIKGSRHSIGYKKSDANFEFKEHTIDVKDGMQFYCSTDGYLDQNGGEKGFPFGKRKFSQLIINNQDKDFSIQEEVLREVIINYQANEIRNDDVTVIGFKI